MAAHAVFAPSSAYRWFACPGSIRMCADLPERISFYADEGTAAHQLAAECLEDGSDTGIHLGQVIDVRGRAHFTVDEGMADAVQLFLDLVRSWNEDGYELHSEVRLDLGHLWPGQFGTADAVLFNAELGYLHIIDFKYGKGVAVEPEENPQLLAYLSGAAKLYHNQNITQVTVSIVQPRVLNHPAVQTWETSVERLAEFEYEFRAAAVAASRLDAALNSGKWCAFCPAAGICPELRDASLRAAQAEFNGGGMVELPAVEKLSAAELGKILSEVNMIELWCIAVRDHALAAALDGDVPDGFKLVAKVTHRRWIDEDKAAGALRALFDLTDDALYVRKLVSPHVAGKLVGKSNAKSLDLLTSRPPGGATLVPLADKRKPLTSDAASEFGAEQ